LAETNRSVRIILFSAALAASFAQFGVVSALEDVARHFGHLAHATSLAAQVGLTGSTLGIGLALVRAFSLVSLPFTALADRWGRAPAIRRWMAGGLALTALAALSPSYWFFVGCFALARPLLSATSTLVQVVTAELAEPRRRVHDLVVLAAGAGAGAGLSAIVHGVVRGPEGFRVLFALAIVPLVALTPQIRRVGEPRWHDPERVARLGRVTLDQRRRLLSLMVVTCAMGIVSGPANGFAFVYGEGVLHLRAGFVAGVVTLSATTGLVGLWASRTLAERVGRRATVRLGFAVTALVSTYAYSGGRSAFTIGYLVGVFGAGLLSPAHVALTTETFTHENRAAGAAWIVVAGVAGAVVGLGLFGWLADRTHGAHVLAAAAAWTFLPTLVALWWLRYVPERRGEVLR
jgi:MFS family permease